MQPGRFAEFLAKELKPWIILSDQQIGELYAHYQLLERWNKRINLTSVEPGIATVIRHYCESLFFGVHLPNEATSVADIGTGAGFPGIPLAILQPRRKITLVESNQRKAVFLREATRHLPNIAVKAVRAENLTDKFDWAVTRAVNPGKMLDLIPRLAPRIGLLLGEDDFSALRGVHHIAWSEPVRLPWGDRRICVFGAFLPTPE